MQDFTKAIEFLGQQGIVEAGTVIVLGTGMHHFIERMQVSHTIPYASIPGFPVSTMEFHQGNLVAGNAGKEQLLVMQGRFHAYEGYTPQQIVFPLRVFKMMGAGRVFLFNAAGGINPNYRKGDLVIIDDHINLQSGNPLTGTNLDELGGRFPDMSRPYDPEIISLLEKNAENLQIPIKKGVYVAVNGPNLETRAEYRFLRTIGADMVGMSTVPEVIAASHMQLPCAAVSIITDECDPDNLKPVNIPEIIEVAGRADKILTDLLFQTLQEL